MDIIIDLPDELVEFFEISSNLLDWGFESKEKMLKHILLEGIEHRLEHLGASQSLDQHRRFHQIIERERNQLLNKSAAVKASDPLTSLKRGFSLVYKEDDQLVKSIKTVSKGESLKTRVQDGLITSTVKQTEGE